MFLTNLLTLISSILGIITFVRKVESISDWTKKLIYTLFVLIILLSTTNIYLIYENNKLTEPQAKIKNFINQWKNSDPGFYSNGQLKGAMVDGMLVLEAFKNKYPDNYKNAMELVYSGHDPRVDEDFWNERNKLEDGFEAVYSIVRGLNSIE